MPTRDGDTAPGGTATTEPGPLTAPLTPTQRDVWLDQQLYPDQPTFSIGCSLELGRDLDRARWEEAVRAVFAAEPVMRTRIEETPDGPRQVVDPGAELVMGFEDGVAGGPMAIRAALQRRLVQPAPTRAQQPFQHWLVHSAEGTWHAALGGPHLLSDGHTFRLFFERASRCYEALVDGRAWPAPRSPSWYDYLREADLQPDDEATLAFWRDHLREAVPVTFRTARRLPGTRRVETARLETEETRAVETLCSTRGWSRSALFLALWAVVLERFREPGGDWVANVIRGSRPPRFTDTMGCFFQVVPYLLREGMLRRAARLDDLVAHLHGYRRQLGRLGEVSMLGLRDCLPAGGCRPVYNAYDFDQVEVLGQARDLEVHFSQAPDELHLVVGMRDGGLELRHFVPTGHLLDDTVAARVRRIAVQAAAGAERVGDLDWLLPGERPRPVAVTDRTAEVPGAWQPVHEAFAAHVARQPEAVALTWRGGSWSYAELAARANRLARVLARRGAGPGWLVGLYLTPSPDQVTAILAVLATGAAYVPIDPASPATRSQLILQDSGVDLLLVDSDPAPLCAGGSRPSPTLRLADLEPELEVEDPSTLGRRPGAADLAYIIYTSGSTGRPKGVMVNHHNVARLFTATRKPFAFGPADVWPLLHSYGFDFSVWELWGALAHGGRLVVVPTEVTRSPEELRDLLAAERVTVLNQTPSAFYRFLEAEAATGSERLASLRWIVFGGEALDPSRLAPWLARYGDERPGLVNMYGITETTVHVTWRRLRAVDCSPGSPSVIGRPLADLEVRLTDAEGWPVPRGVAGEIQVGGAGVARGYLRQEELTAERFIDDPVDPTGDRLYRTGDLARELPDGDLVYLGRLDDQVQVRGYRVEPGEVAAALRRHPGVCEVAVVARPDCNGEPSLVAYVVRAAGPEVPERELRELLRARLPEYMACSRYCFLPALPLTAHGKLDRAGLPDLGQERPDLAAGYAAPRTQPEELLAALFAEAAGVDRVGIHDRFFDLGGNSLSATWVVARARELFGVGMPIAAIFELPTVADLAEAIAAGRFVEEVAAPPPVEPTPAQGNEFPLTFAQERVWLIQQIHPRSVAYHFEARLELHGALDAALLEACLSELVDRHAVLRTTFPVVDGRPLQRVHPEGPVALERVDLTRMDPEEGRRRVEAWRRETAGRPFALDRLPLVRWTLFRLAGDEHVLLHREHHLLHDGWSFVVFVGELLELYRARRAGAPSPLAPLPLRLGDFALAERAWMNSPAAERQLAFWRERLAGAPASLELPTDFARPQRPSYSGDSFRQEVPPELVRSVRELARGSGVTFFSAMLGLFAVLMARTSGQDDLCIGSGVANRRRRETEGILGMLLNNVVLRLDLSSEDDVATLLARTQRVVLDALANQDLPFDRAVRLVSGEDGAPATPAAVCPVFFSSWDGPVPRVPVPGLVVDVEAGLPNGSAKFDLNVILVVQPAGGFAPPPGAPSDDRAFLIWEYASDLFERTTVERLATQYLELLRAGSAGAERPWREVAAESVAPVLALGRGGTPPYPREASVVDLWRAQVARTPEAVALRCAGDGLTYHQLDEAANRLAHWLVGQGVEAGEVVAVCCRRGPQAVVAMLAVLAAGAAYLPLDPRDPEHRLAALLTDAGARRVLGDAASWPRLGACRDAKRILLDSLEAQLGGLPAREPPRLPGAEDLAYVMYTSGSTGEPKGVEIVHRGIVRLVHGGFADLAGGRRLLQLAPLSFDAATFEIWGALLHGGTVVVHPEDVPDLAALGRTIADEGVDTMWLNASLFDVIVDRQPEILAPVAQLLIGGEALSVEHVRRAATLLPRTRLVNGYGPTENTTFSCTWPIPHDLPADARSVPIGRPLAHSTVYVLDAARRPLPWGAVGEIWLGGDGLARGYRGRPDLTAAAFLPDPFADEPGGRLYRSGDLGRWRTDGTLEFRGRRDEQVKLRGFRIEPAEVEAALKRLDGVASCAVLAQWQDGRAARLVAWVVPRPGTTLDPARLREAAGREMPAHLVPAEVVLLDRLPLTPNGKLDRSALPAPGAAVGRPPLTARSAREEIVAGIVADVLERDEVDVETSFFDLGGHSLLGLELLARLARAFSVEIPPAGLIEHPTARGLTALVEDRLDRAGSGAAGTRSLVRIKPGGSRPPLFFTPGGDGGAGALLVYAKLARFLDAEQPFYGLEARRGDGLPPHASVEEMAADYLAEVRQVQPRGPYVFGGECIGGVIAYEMGRQALAAGEEVGLVVLLDSRPPRLASVLRHRLREMSSEARRRLDARLDPLPGSHEALAAGRSAQGLALVVRRFLDGLLPYDGREAPATVEPEWVAYQRTLLAYRARPYSGRVALLLSEQYDGRGVAQEWQRLVVGLEVHRAPGNHDSYIRGHARATATILEACLAQVSREPSA